MSREKFECFTCRDNGYPGVLIFLAGKDEHGKAIRVEEDGSKHLHKTKQQSQQQTGQGSTTIVTEPMSMKIINAKLDRIIALLESQEKK